MFFYNSCFFDDSADVGNLISCSSAFSKASLNIWKFTFTYCWGLAWTFLKPWVNQSVFLTELCICFEICLLVLPKTNLFSFLKSWADSGSTNQYSVNCFMAGGQHTLCHSISKMHILGEGPGENSLSLEMLPLSDSQLSNRPHVPWQKLTKGNSFCPLLMSLSEDFRVSFIL